VFNGVCKVWTSCFEKFIEIVLRLSCLVLKITLGGCDIPFIEVISFLVIIVVGLDSNPLGALLPPLLVALGILPDTLDSDAGWCHLAAAGDCFTAAWDNLSPDDLLIGDILVSNVQQLLSGLPEERRSVPGGTVVAAHRACIPETPLALAP
jgi:hypothetical protein